jgi:hypothetical protein
VNDAERAHAERLAELLLEQLELLGLSEHAEAWILSTVARRLTRRMVELGEVIEQEAREIDDLSALQMATALEALGPAVERILGQIAEHGRFGLVPSREPTALPTPPWEATESPGVSKPEVPRPIWTRQPRQRRPNYS